LDLDDVGAAGEENGDGEEKGKGAGGEEGNEKEGEGEENKRGEEKGKYRSMFLWKNEQRGTESVWAGMEKV
jgi:hypothetical protein